MQIVSTLITQPRSNDGLACRTHVDGKHLTVGVAQSTDEAQHLSAEGLACLRVLWTAHKNRGADEHFLMHALPPPHDVQPAVHEVLASARDGDIILLLGPDLATCEAAVRALRVSPEAGLH